MSTCLNLRIVTMQVWMTTEKHLRPLINQCRVWTSEVTVGSTEDHMMLTDMIAWMTMM